MLSWTEARDKVIEIVRARKPRRRRRETASLERALGRVLAAPAVADRDSPAFARAIRDGFAVRAADTEPAPAVLAIAGEVRAGAAFSGAIGPSQAVRIMTGAPVPDGADAVVMVEHTRLEGDGRVAIERAARPGQHIVARAAEARCGDRLLEPGARIGFAELALLSQVGCSAVKVFRQPRVAVLATGDEIVPPDCQPGPFEIRDTNSACIAAQARIAGARPVPFGRAADQAETLGERVREALEAEVDVLVLSGGVSMGKYDLVEDVLRGLGAEFFFDAVAIRPGRPAVFGWCRNRPVFGLPGNPVSAMVTFELLVVPALDLLAGAGPRPLPLVQARLDAPLEEKGELTHFLPAQLGWTPAGLVARPVRWRGSGDLAGLAQSNGFLVVPPEKLSWQAGESIQALLRRDLL
ncbi:MAG TPA: gephyrin-like molybdotransferase Glp [Candidatus Acidoferrales bacterium]|nr:gephyrin-like molybdotransferase Glp [Candidatus Acidoferrales bacterium]